jgi:acyl-ACP thioesterase
MNALPREREPHHAAFRVHSYDVDPWERLTPRSLCALLQEAAGQDAENLGVSMSRLVEGGLAWVLQRLKIEVAAYPSLGATLTVATWARHFGRVVAERDFEVRGEGGRPLAAATSRWVVMDMAARRVVRLPDFIRELPVHGARALEMDGGELPLPEPPAIERRLEVRRGDLDVARHVNNTRYVEWALEAVPDEVYETQEPRAFEIVFRRESVFRDRIVSVSRDLAPDGGLQFAHALWTAEGGDPLAQAVSRWRPRQGGGRVNDLGLNKAWERLPASKG